MLGTRRTNGQAGFSLLELAIVLIISGIMLKFGLQAYAGYAEQEYREITKTRMAAIEEALVSYVQRNRRLPCPADGTLAMTHNDSGKERLAASPSTTSCASANQNSVVPWRELGIPHEVATDGWRRRITYRVFNGATGFTRNIASGSATDGMNMTECRASATNNVALVADACPTASPYRAPIAFIENKGFEVRDGTTPGNPLRHPNTATVNAGGAVFVLISHGKDGAGAYTPTGAKLPNPTGALQLANVNHTAAAYRMAQQNENPSAGANFFDDIVLAPTIHAIAVRAGLGPQ